jgi:hypothetical protein
MGLTGFTLHNVAAVATILDTGVKHELVCPCGSGK